MPTTEEWIDELKGISVLELSERIKALDAEVERLKQTLVPHVPTDWEIQNAIRKERDALLLKVAADAFCHFVEHGLIRKRGLHRSRREIIPQRHTTLHHNLKLLIRSLFHSHYRKRRTAVRLVGSI